MRNLFSPIMLSILFFEVTLINNLKAQNDNEIFKTINIISVNKIFEKDTINLTIL